MQFISTSCFQNNNVLFDGHEKVANRPAAPVPTEHDVSGPSKFLSIDLSGKTMNTNSE